MNWLFDNPLANMSGTSFLIFYAVAIATALIIYGIIKSRLDSTARMALPPIPSSPDAYEIAYLRGGQNELARTVIFALTTRNFLKIINTEKKSSVVQTDLRPERGQLTHFEKTVYDFFSTPRETNEIFRDNELGGVLQTFSTTYEARLKQQNLLSNEQFQANLSRLALLFAVIIGGLGIYRLIATILQGYSNITFLVLMSIAGVGAVYAMSKMPRISKLGRAYLERMQTAFDRLKMQINTPTFQTETANANFGGADVALLTMGVFGVAALSGTAFGEYEKAFHKASATGGGCGLGCGASSCASGGSDGGGDGGGGCGGCGGGCS